MTQIIVTKPGVLSVKDKAALRRLGVVAIEADNPADVRLIQAEGAALSGDEMLYAAMCGVNQNYAGQQAFAKAVFDALNHARAEARAAL